MVFDSATVDVGITHEHNQNKNTVTMTLKKRTPLTTATTTTTTKVGDVLEFTRSFKNKLVWKTEDQLQGLFYILGGTKVLVLEKDEKNKAKPNKILFLTGEHTGKTGYEYSRWLDNTECYKKI